jgi:hypothetical protein
MPSPPPPPTTTTTKFHGRVCPSLTSRWGASDLIERPTIMQQTKSQNEERKKCKYLSELVHTMTIMSRRLLLWENVSLAALLL